jgi:hypothetical protein
MRGTLLGASVTTAVVFAYTAFILVIDPAMTPIRMGGAVLLATVLGLTWGRVIWNRRHR